MLRKLNLLVGLVLLALVAAPAEAQRPPVVCRVTPEGEVICDPVIGPDGLSKSRAAQKQAADFAKAFAGDGNWGPNKIKLLMGMIEVLGQSPLRDEPNIPRRSGEIVQSVKLLLD